MTNMSTNMTSQEAAEATAFLDRRVELAAALAEKQFAAAEALRERLGWLGASLLFKAIVQNTALGFLDGKPEAPDA